MWHGYMASQLSSVQLIGFAFLTFLISDLRMKGLLVATLLTGACPGRPCLQPRPSADPALLLGVAVAMLCGCERVAVLGAGAGTLCPSHVS